MINYFLTNCDSTTNENIRHLMQKYNFDMHRKYSSITPLLNQID